MRLSFRVCSDFKFHRFKAALFIYIQISSVSFILKQPQKVIWMTSACTQAHVHSVNGPSDWHPNGPSWPSASETGIKTHTHMCTHGGVVLFSETQTDSFPCLSYIHFLCLCTYGAVVSASDQSHVFTSVTGSGVTCRGVRSEAELSAEVQSRESGADI